MHRCKRSSAPRRIAIDSQNSGTCELALERIFEALCAVPERKEVAIPALGTGGGYAFRVPAVMATQGAALAMHYEPRRTARTHGLPAAGDT
jgi:hypothetical protein